MIVGRMSKDDLNTLMRMNEGSCTMSHDVFANNGSKIMLFVNFQGLG